MHLCAPMRPYVYFCKYIDIYDKRESAQRVTA